MSIIGLGVLLYAAGASEGTGAAPAVQTDEAVEARELTGLPPERLGGLARERVVELDAETLTIFGAIDGAMGEYQSDMSLMLLRYRSPELAANAIDALRSAMFPERAGWQSAAQRGADPARRFLVQQTSTGQMASVWNYGSLVMIFSGAGAQMAKFAAPQEVLATR